MGTTGISHADALHAAPQLRVAADRRGRPVIYVARQLGHDAPLTLGTYGRLMGELGDVGNVTAEGQSRLPGLLR